MILKKGIQVKIISGKDKGKTGEVIQIFTKPKKALVSGINMSIRHLKQSEKNYEIKISSSDDQKFQFNLEDKISTVDRVLLTKKTISFDVDQSLVNLEFKVNGKIISLFRQGFTFTFENITNLYKSNEADVQESNIVAPITGSIAKIMVKNGQIVSKENPVIFIEAMKMEYQLVAPKSGKVSGLKNKKGDLIEKGQTLLEIE